MQKEFVMDLENAAGMANSEILFSEIAQEGGRFDNPWLIFTSYIDAVDGIIYKPCYQNGKVHLEGQKYLCQLTVLP